MTDNDMLLNKYMIMIETEKLTSDFFRLISSALTLSRCGETPPLFITTPLAPVGQLWLKVFVGAKNPGRWPWESTNEAQTSPGSDGGNATGPGTH